MSENSPTPLCLQTESALRAKIKSLVAEYYEAVHRPVQERAFEPGATRVHYAGRVFDADEMLALTDALLDFWLTSGRFTEAFEKRLASYLGLRFSILVNSGSSANLVAFNALTSPLMGPRRIQKGDEVITVAAAFPTTVAPIIGFGAVPVFVDITLEDGTYNIDVTQLEAAYSPRTRAVFVAHTLGNPVRIKEIRNFCAKFGLWFIEDNCDALGSLYEGKLTGTFGDVATSSFYPPHHITMGEGGAVYTNNSLIKRAADSFRDWGRDCWCPSGKDNTCKKRFGWELGSLPKGYDHKYIYSHLGYNLKATEMQASIGLAQLEKLDFFTKRRRANFNFLREALADLEKYFVMPNPTPGSTPSWFGFPLTVREDAPFTREMLLRFLEEGNIQTRMLFSGNLIRHPAFEELRASGKGFRVVGDLPNTNAVMERTFWLGVYPGLAPAALEYMVERLRRFQAP